ncbi:MAG: DUF4255 domain-containing protein [Wenzhouxiangellaceae bacterium]
MYTALRSTTVTLTEMLEQHLENDPGLRTMFNPDDGGTMVVSASTPQEMVDHNLAGLSVWLYRIDRDEQLLNHPPPRPGFARRERRGLSLRLHYLVTPIADGNQDGTGPPLEQSILGKVLQTFHDHPLLSGVDLHGDFSGSGLEIAVRLEPLGLEEITRVWDALERSYQLCVSYEVSVVMVASDAEAASTSPVDAVLGEYGVITAAEESPV